MIAAGAHSGRPNTVSGGGTPYLNNSGGFAATLSGNSWQEGPYGGSAAAVPGTVQAENYNTGGQGVAYNVNSVNGTANGYRADGVDLEATGDTGGGYNLGWTSTGQWFRYTVDVAEAGVYSVAMRVAAPGAANSAFHLADSSGTNLSGPVSVPATGGWQNWSTVTAQVTLPAGRQTVTIYQDNGGWNLNSLLFTTAGQGQSSPGRLKR
ncbi:carbohydrate-binding protein [Kribbella sp. NPDC059898]|uniref:carbohydrate-binding protein n=1 Tax=Kribbella sp. NPDC059898 TaxID=3346995 RepID=UPI00365D22E0